MVKKADPSSSSNLTDDQMASLALEDAFYEKQYQTGVLAGVGTDFAGNIFDYMNRIGGAKLAEQLASKQAKRAQDIIDRAGEGAEDRLATARGQKMAAARGALDTAAKQAAMDPTGVGVIELTRRAPEAIKSSGDVSGEQTQEMERSLREKKLGLEAKDKAEKLALSAKHQKQTARFQLAKDAITSAGTLAAALKPSSYEAAQERKSARGEAQALRQTKRQKNLDEKMGTAEAVSIRGQLERKEITDKEASEAMSSIDERRQKKGLFGKTRAQRYDKAQARKEAGLKKQAAADQNLDELFKAKMAKFNALQGKKADARKTAAEELADTVTPTIKRYENQNPGLTVDPYKRT